MLAASTVIVSTPGDTFHCFHPMEIVLAAQTLQRAILTRRRMFFGLDLEAITEDKLVSGVTCSDSTVENHTM